MKRRWRGWGDRYDGYGILVGLACFALLGVLLGVVLDGGLGGWLGSFGIACGVTNITSFVLRRRA